jgi:hypothetical protein
VVIKALTFDSLQDNSHNNKDNSLDSNKLHRKVVAVKVVAIKEIYYSLVQCLQKQN